MKKFFTFIAAALCAVSVNAQTSVSVTWADGENGVAEPETAATAIARNVGAGLTANGTSKFGDMTLAKFDQNTGSDKGTNNLSSAVSLDKYVEYTFVPQGGSFSAKNIKFDCVKNGTGDPNIFVDIIDGSGETTHVADNVVILRNNETGSSTLEYKVNSASSEGAFALRIYVGKLASGKSVSIANVVIEGELISADAPVIGINPDAITLRATPWQRTQTATVLLSGKNLEDGEYTVTVPNAAGLSIEPTTFTVAEGVVGQEFTITYTTEEEVAASEAVFAFAAGEKTTSLTVNYSSKGKLTTLASTSSDTEWDFEQLTETIELTDESAPSKSDWVVYADFESVVFPATFKANSIAFKGQFPLRSKKAQAGALKIKISDPGTLDIDFSDTGSSGDGVERYLAINGNINLVILDETETQQIYTKRDGTTDRKVAENIAVMPGEITISAKQVDPDTQELVDSYVCYYNVKYTWNEDVTKGTPVGISEVKAQKADNAIYNLAGQRVEKALKGLYIQNGKKYVVK